MDIFNYHPTTKEFLGVGKADPNPMEEGNWLLPAFSTTTAPPNKPAGKALVWTSNSWFAVPDHRGEIWWKADAEFNSEPGVPIDFLGDPSERGLTNVEPPSPLEPAPEPVTVSPAQIRIALTRIGLRGDVEAYVAASSDQDVKDMWQYATQFARNNLMIVGAAETLGKSPAEIDALFELAKSI